MEYHCRWLIGINLEYRSTIVPGERSLTWIFGRLISDGVFYLKCELLMGSCIFLVEYSGFV